MENEAHIDALIECRQAIRNLHGVTIPYNIIKHNMIPFSEWLDAEIKRIETGD